MCLTSDGRVFTATKDIVTYKVLLQRADGSFYTPFMNSNIILGRTYRLKSKEFKPLWLVRPADITPVNDTMLDFAYGGGMYHSYPTLENAESLRRALYRPWMKPAVIVKTIIPRGTEYIEGYDCTFSPSVGSKKIKYTKEIM